MDAVDRLPFHYAIIRLVDMRTGESDGGCVMNRRCYILGAGFSKPCGLPLARELTHPLGKRALYLLDEPTVGLHYYDIELLLTVLNKLVEKGNTVVVIEHNMQIIKSADYIIDLGPEGGEKGGRVITKGTPEEVSESKYSYTGKYLQEYL